MMNQMDERILKFPNGPHKDNLLNDELFLKLLQKNILFHQSQKLS